MNMTLAGGYRRALSMPDRPLGASADAYGLVLVPTPRTNARAVPTGGAAEAKN